MFVTIELSSNLSRGTVVQYDTASKKFVAASSSTYPLGVIIREPEQDAETQVWSTRACFAGVCYAVANSSIVDEGGPLSIVSGKVEIGTAESAAGVISPISRGDSSRNAGDLVMIYLR